MGAGSRWWLHLCTTLTDRRAHICLNICLKLPASLSWNHLAAGAFFGLHKQAYLSEPENITYTAQTLPLVSPAVDLRRSCFLVFSWRAHRSCYFWMLLTEHVIEVYFCELANIITGWASCHVGNKSGSRRMCSLKEIDEMPDYDPGSYKIIICQKGRSDIYGMPLSWVVSRWKVFCIIRRLHLTTNCKLQALKNKSRDVVMETWETFW